MLDHVEQNAPLRRSVSIEEVGNAAAFFARISPRELPAR